MKIYRANIELCLFLNVNLTVIFLFLFSKLGTGSRHKDGCIYRVHGKKSITHTLWLISHLHDPPVKIDQ